MTTQKMPKKSIDFYCEICDFKCSKKSNFEKHLHTLKHKRQQENNGKNAKINQTYNCINCTKIFKDRAGLWRHSKKCNFIKNNETKFQTENIDETKTDKDLIMLLIKENSELKNMMMETQNQMMEVIKNGTHNTTNNNNSHNKTFNLQFFLNETCKNAMNIMDFVESLKLQLSDLEKMGEIGYVNGMSNIIIKNLKDMEVTDRPMHCTDVKRETLYIKDEDKWDKESDGNPKMKKAIKHIARKNAMNLKDFKEKHPDCTKADSKHSDTYNKLLVEAMGGKGENDAIKEDKIIKKVTKEIIVDK
jgi:hypothetical protein